MQSLESEQLLLLEKFEESQRDQTRATAQIYREIEKQHSNFNMKLNQSDLLSLIDTKIEKSQVVAMLLNKVDKQELEQQLSEKADLSELRTMLHALESKFEDEFASISDQLSRKARTEDLAYYRKEQNFKASKEEVDTLR